ncbi:MAG TPA: protein-methionine-sulfoxide reductase heme-binding subunit MsrQ [Candidatus Methylomirabilis sp.]|nr:protein-methionine-sulfoxide reductase heme-binding subunit MsrQ [Candidatus Methylomirabilis sp.]
MSRRYRIVLKSIVWVLCLAPLAVLAHRAYLGDLTANPISFITNTLGQWTFRLLLASLALTPLRLVFGISWPVSLRRLLGLFAFSYACLHFSVWIGVDHFFDWKEMGTDILKRPYITVGMLALASLIPLAATSTAGMVRRLGGTNWRRLHRLVYFAGCCAAFHFLWLAKKGRTVQFLYAAILILLLGVRLWDAARRLLHKRRVRRAVTDPAMA